MWPIGTWLLSAINGSLTASNNLLGNGSFVSKLTKLKPLTLLDLSSLAQTTYNDTKNSSSWTGLRQSDTGLQPWDTLFHWDPDTVFLFLFLFRYIRLVVHIISFLAHTSVPVRKSPALDVQDATIVIPSVDPTGSEFEECVRSILANSPAYIIVVTVGQERLHEAIQVCKNIHPTIIEVKAIEKANKRMQVLHALPFVNTRVTVLVDDHVFWPTQFLRYLLAPFGTSRVGGVGTKKRVRRFNQGFSFADFWNFMGCVYLERHNFEIAATSNMDGGVFCMSGRTSAIRTSILKQEDFMKGFGNEMILNRWGPLNADDDNFITRFLVRNGWDIKFQMQDEATMETTLGEYPKFLQQCLRWVRTTWRSNSASLFTDRTVWYRQPWSVYAIYWTSFFNFALFYDALLIYTLLRTSYGGDEHCNSIGHHMSSTQKGDCADYRLLLTFLLFWIMASKTVKLLPHFIRCPGDIVYFPGYVMFAYFHSFIKLYAGLTFYVTSWGSRPAQVA